MSLRPKWHRRALEDEVKRSAERARRANRFADRFRRGSAWRRLARWFRAAHPLCTDPYGDHARQGRAVASEHVHHIESVEARPDLALSADNLAALCASCHSRVEADEAAGRATRHRFSS